MLWVLKRSVSMRRFFLTPKVKFKLMDEKIGAILRKLFLLNWPYVVWIFCIVPFPFLLELHSLVLTSQVPDILYDRFLLPEK